MNVQATFSGVLSDPANWTQKQVMTEFGYELFYRCPRCAVLTQEPYQHKGWHLQSGV